MNRVTVSSSPAKVTLHYGQPVKVTLRYDQKGERGIGISSVALDEQAHLIVTYDDGKTQDAGAALGDVTSIKDGIDSTYKKIQASEANVTKLEASTKANADKARQALQDTQSASTSGVNTINTLTTEKMTYMTNTFNSLLTQAKANIDQWERDAENKIHKVRTYSLEQIKTAHDDAMVDIERSVNKSEAWAVSETSPDRDTDMESPTGLTMSSKSWALYTKNKVIEAIDSIREINTLIVRADAIKTDIDNTYKNVLQSETNASGFADKAKISETNAYSFADKAKTSETNAKVSETNAKTSEANANFYKNAAANSAAAAANSASEASASETNSANSAKASASSAAAAKESETNAKASADRASSSLETLLNGQVNADWAVTDNTNKAFIKNKPDLTVYVTKTELETKYLGNIVFSVGKNNKLHISLKEE